LQIHADSNPAYKLMRIGFLFDADADPDVDVDPDADVDPG
jgi:hypothetical protein